MKIKKYYIVTELKTGYEIISNDLKDLESITKKSFKYFEKMVPKEVWTINGYRIECVETTSNNNMYKNLWR